MFHYLDVRIVLSRHCNIAIDRVWTRGDFALNSHEQEETDQSARSLYIDVGHLDEKQTQALQAFKALLFAQGLYKQDPKPTHDEATLLRCVKLQCLNLNRSSYKLHLTLISDTFVRESGMHKPH